MGDDGGIGVAGGALLEPHTDLTDASPAQVIVRGEGCYVWDDEGNRYLEAISGLWCASLGFSDDRLILAARRQLERLPFYGSFDHRTHDGALALADDLIAVAPDGFAKVFFANSGSEATDTAIKLAWYLAALRDEPLRRTIVSFDRGYHGSTVAAASASGLSRMHDGFGLPLPGFAHVTTPDPRQPVDGEAPSAFARHAAQRFVDEIESIGPSSIAAFIAEPVLGAGGLIFPPPDFFRLIEPYLRRHGILFVADEVITAFGRTGEMFATQTYGLEPQIITVSKGLASSYVPISAVLVHSEVAARVEEGARRWGKFSHGFTCSGHPVAAAVAREALAVYGDLDICAHVRFLAPDLAERIACLESHPLVSSTECAGFLAGIRMAATDTADAPTLAARLVAAARAHGLVVRAMHDTVVLAPPLISETGHFAEAAAKLRLALDNLTDLQDDRDLARPPQRSGTATVAVRSTGLPLLKPDDEPPGGPSRDAQRWWSREAEGEADESWLAGGAGGGGG
jgi:4-aminobutyrate--pyruvate transaminase